MAQYPVIFHPPALTRRPNDPTALQCRDAVALENGLPTGGVLLSVHSPCDAVAWLESHYDHPLVRALRSRNRDGPIAIQLSADEPALAIFGSVSDRSISRRARELAQISGFTVMVRPKSENPIPCFGGGPLRHAWVMKKSIFKCDFLESESKLKQRRQIIAPDGNSETFETADVETLPWCRYGWGNGWTREDSENAGKDFKSYDISWRPANDREKVADKTEVEFGLGLHLRHNEAHKSGVPQVSSIVRNQIFIWVYDPELRSKARGVMLSTSTYIPNALIGERLTMHESVTAYLDGACTRGKFMHRHAKYDSYLSTDTPIDAPMKSPTLGKSKKNQRWSTLLTLCDKLFLTSTGKVARPQLPVMDTISRGWDVENMRWNNVVWPLLDLYFQRIKESSQNTTWKFQWVTNTIPSGITPPAGEKRLDIGCFVAHPHGSTWGTVKSVSLMHIMEYFWDVFVGILKIPVIRWPPARCPEWVVPYKFLRSLEPLERGENKCIETGSTWTIKRVRPSLEYQRFQTRMFNVRPQMDSSKCPRSAIQRQGHQLRPGHKARGKSELSERE
ncbi:hypothetical protein B0H13DRAFT_1921908 [Mycena leptocephala]|nr:hypothetical protein B0H13DRAFT_1921908 [Mycena leptocephala]